MNIKPIRNDDDLRAAFKRLEPVFQAQEGTPEADEHKHYPMVASDPVDAIKFRGLIGVGFQLIYSF
ncbi:MAG: hypothetical protein ACYC4S_06990 [Rhodoferax sp.]